MSRVEVIGPATLYLGDCVEVLPTLGVMDALVTDPPYVFSTRGGGRFLRRRGLMKRIDAAGLNKGFDLGLLSAAQFRSAVVFCHNDQLATVLPRMHAEWGRYVVCYWRKLNAVPLANRHYRPDVEPYIHAWSKGAHPIGDLMQLSRSVEANTARHSGVDHPTVKPDDVMGKILANVNGETICDPFMGSGSTGVAALRAGRSFVGIERDPEWFDLACRRIDAAWRRGRLFAEAA